MNRSDPDLTDHWKWASFVLFCAGLYNLAWGAFAAVAPASMLGWLGVPAVAPLAIWQCLGMVVGLYGLAYLYASTDPARYWPVILVGLLGKVFGPMGAVLAIMDGELPYTFLWLNVFNDVIWWVPFLLILGLVRRSHRSVRACPESETAMTLYRRTIGPDFDDMTSELRRFHAATEPIEVNGHFEIIRGRGALANFLADRAGFPPSTGRTPGRLLVRQAGGGEHWERLFGEWRIDSWQEQRHGLLTEKIDGVLMYLRPRVVDGALVITDIRSTFCGLPLPPFLTPRVDAHAMDGEDGIDVRIAIVCTPIGLLVEYRGTIAMS